MASDVIHIDGGALEGGGQILRNAISLSCILRQPISVCNIRAKRDNPGLRPQHLSGLEVVRDICDGKLDGGHVGSCSITFHPGYIQSGSFFTDTKTAGSVCLLMQAALPCMLFARGPMRLQLRGGTNAAFAPQIDYFMQVFQPMVKRFGVDFNIRLIRRGFYPRGGGEVIVEANPISSLRSVELLDRGNVVQVTGRAFVAGTLPVRLAHVMADTARDIIRQKHKNIPVKIEAVKDSDQAAFGNGSGIILVAETSAGCLLAGSGLGSRGVEAEKVGADAASELLRNIDAGGCIDDFLQDQIIILMALAHGKSLVRVGQITLHTQTSIHVMQLLTKAMFVIHKESDSVNVIECDGIGLDNGALGQSV